MTPARPLLPKPNPIPPPPHTFPIPTAQPLPQQPIPTKPPEPPTYNSPISIEVPKSTKYYQNKRKAENDNDDKRAYSRKKIFNICAHCQKPKTKDFGHSRHIGQNGTLEKFKMADLLRSVIFVHWHISQMMSNIYGIFRSGKCTRMVYHMSVKELYVVFKSIRYFSVFTPIFTNLHPSILQYIYNIYNCLRLFFLRFSFFGL